MSTIINKTDPSGYTEFDLMAVGSATLTLGSKTSANSIPVVIASDQGAVPVSGTLTVNAGTGTFNIQSNASVNISQVAGSSVATAATGTQLVGIADGAGNKITTNSTTYTSKFGLDVNLLGTLGTAFSTAGKVDVKGADGDVFIRQATASNLNATVVGTGTFAVQAAQSGTWTVQPGNTANTTPWLTTSVPPSAGATGWQSKQMGDGTVGSNWNGTKQQVSGSACTFGGYVMLYNPNTAVSYIQVFNKTSANVTLGTTTPDYVIPIPGVASAAATGAAANNEIMIGVKFSTALTMAITTTPTGSTAPANNCYGWILYN